MTARTGRRAEAGIDVEAVLDGLYTTPPSDFVARRETLAASTKTAGRADDARRIHAARRPTLAAWAANLLLRARPQESRQFLELGAALREAYQALDAAALKDLSAQRRSVVSALSRQTAQLARDAGNRLAESVQREVEDTLRAVLADPDAAEEWAGGRLVNALTPPSDFRLGAETAPPAEKPRGQTPPPRAKGDLAARERARQEELAQEREAVEAADQRLRERRAQQADADTELQRARRHALEARQRMSAAQEQAQRARAEYEQAETDHHKAEAIGRSATAALEQAGREVAELKKNLRRITAHTG